MALSCSLPQMRSHRKITYTIEMATIGYVILGKICEWDFRKCSHGLQQATAVKGSTMINKSEHSYLELYTCFNLQI